MLLDAGAALTIVGHSERREAQQETDSDVRGKAAAALAAGLKVILCVGESFEVRERGDAVVTVSRQLDASLPGSIDRAEAFAVAYEPIWAIGTGKVPTTADIGEMHSALRQRLVRAYGADGEGVRILYGGSVKARIRPKFFGAILACPMAPWSAARASRPPTSSRSLSPPPVEAGRNRLDRAELLPFAKLP